MQGSVTEAGWICLICSHFLASLFPRGLSKLITFLWSWAFKWVKDMCSIWMHVVSPQWMFWYSDYHFTHLQILQSCVYFFLSLFTQETCSGIPPGKCSISQIYHFLFFSVQNISLIILKSILINFWWLVLKAADGY
jgi:hypothetical protein